MKPLFTLMLCLGVVMTSFSQDSEAWTSGCSAEASEVFAPIIGEAAYSTACNALETCKADDTPAVACEFAVYDALMSQCAAEETVCQFESSFYMASLLIFDPTSVIFNPNVNSFHPPVEIMPAALTSFRAGDYQAVIELYEALPSDRTQGGEKVSPMRFFIPALLHQDPDAASKAYADAIKVFRSPFVTYQYARFLAAQGYEDAAAVEGLYLQRFTEQYPLVSPAAEEITSAYPFSEETLQDWTLYEVSFVSSGEGGESAHDFSLLPGKPIQGVVLSNGTLFTLGMVNLIGFQDYGNAPLPLTFYASGEAYFADTPKADEGVSLRFEEAIAEISWYYAGMFGGSAATYLIAGSEEPDPRLGRYERCEGGARWRLSVGGYASPRTTVENTASGAPQYYDAPDGNPIDYFSYDIYKVHITDGPVCIEGTAWWEVDLLNGDAARYWIPEAVSDPVKSPALAYQFNVTSAPR